MAVVLTLVSHTEDSIPPNGARFLPSSSYYSLLSSSNLSAVLPSGIFIMLCWRRQGRKGGKEKFSSGLIALKLMQSLEESSSGFR